jgi:outer membrane biosynthesis protein TonB
MKKILFLVMFLATCYVFGQKKSNKKAPSVQEVQLREINEKVPPPPVSGSVSNATIEIRNPSSNDIFNDPDISAAPTGDYAKYLSTLANKIAYPDDGSEKNYRGKIIVSFIVEKDGSFSSVKYEKDFGDKSGQNIINILKTTPK